MIVVDMTCNTCGVDYPSSVDYFVRDWRCGKITPTCRACDRRRRQSWRASNPDKVQDHRAKERSKRGHHQRLVRATSEPLTPPEKACSKCHVTQPNTVEFFPKRYKTELLEGICRVCVRVRRHENYHRNPKKHVEYRECARVRNRQSNELGGRASKRTCTICKKEKPAGSFAVDDDLKGGIRGQCKNCLRLYRRRNAVVNWANKLLASSRTGAKRRGLEHTLTRDDLMQLFDNQGGLCFWFGHQLNVCDPECKNAMVSIDRIDNAVGYVCGNVVLTTQFANLGRQSAPPEQFAKYLREAFGVRNAPMNKRYD